MRLTPLSQLRAASCRPACRGSAVETGRLYYQCVYWRQELEADLVAAHAHARAAFAAEGSGGASFMPHLSLVYGELSEAAKAKAAAAASEELAALAETSFVPAALSLWKTVAGQTESWWQIEDVPL